MLPTLKVEDRLIIDKVSFKLNGIRRGEIVVFHAPPASRLDVVMIKGVIGLPGETVSIKKGVVYINGKPLTESYEKMTKTIYCLYQIHDIIMTKI